MNKVLRQLHLEKSLLFPAGLMTLWLAFILSLVPLLTRIGLPRWLPLLSVPWFAVGYFTALDAEKRIKKLRWVLDTVAAVLLWCGAAYLLLPDDLILRGLTMQEPWPFWGLALTAILSWRTGSFFFSRLRLPFLVPDKRETLGSDFHSWLHNYLQGHSVRRSVSQARQGILLILFGTVAGHAVSLELGAPPGIPTLLVSAAGAAAGLILISALFRMAVYTSWIVDGVRVQRSFFRLWLRFATIAVLSATLFVALLPTGFELVNRHAVWEGIKGLVRILNKTGQPEKRPFQPDKKALEKINREKQQRLDQLKAKEPILKILLRVALYGLLVLFLLALIGAFGKRRYPFKTPPALWRLPIMLWELLWKFLQVVGYFLRLFFLGGYQRGQKRSIRYAEQSLAELLPEAEALSDEKKQEIREIIALYLQFVRAAGNRGFSYRQGETPAEFNQRLSSGVPALEEPGGSLTEHFYFCRYARDPAGRAVLNAAADDLSRCLQILNRVERIL